MYFKGMSLYMNSKGIHMNLKRDELYEFMGIHLKFFGMSLYEFKRGPYGFFEIQAPRPGH